jgi:hypothetical protein
LLTKNHTRSSPPFRRAGKGEIGLQVQCSDEKFRYARVIIKKLPEKKKFEIVYANFAEPDQILYCGWAEDVENLAANDPELSAQGRSNHLRWKSIVMKGSQIEVVTKGPARGTSSVLRALKQVVFCKML